MNEGKAAELGMLREMLEGCEADLIRYRHHGGNPVLKANYEHKMEQAERLRAKIKALEEEKGV